MLTDSSLTNIFLVSGVSHIRYRVYSQQCERSQLARLLKSEAVPESISLSNHHWPKDHQPESILIQAFRNLVQLNIPCVWRPAPTTQLEEEKASNKDDDDDDVVLLELWVFWFDDRHTGLVDNNEMLKQLEEIKMGSFTWENTIAKNISPTASPITGNTSSSSASVATVINRVSNEYILFVKAVKRLIRCSILQKGGVLPLGEFFIFSHKSDMTHDILPYTTESATINDSMLSCTYNVYLSNTNLVVQPDVRRLEIRPLSLSDLDKKEGTTTTVITSPLGERAAILPMHQDIPEQLEEKILREWSLLFDIPLRCLNSCRQQRPCAAPKLPALTPIRSLRGDVVLYPTALLFISTASITLSSTNSDMNGVLRYHQGYTEDLVQQWNHWWWSDQITHIATRNKTQQQHPHHHHHHASSSLLNYWDYGSPKLHTASAMFDTLSMTAENISANGVLTKALGEPVGSSPIMASKTVATPASLGCKNETMSPPSTKEGEENRRVEEESELSVADFARIHFADPIEKQQQQSMLTSPDVKPEPVTTTTTTTTPVQEIPITASTTAPPTMNISNNNTMGYMDSTALLLSGGATTDQMAVNAAGNTTTTTDDAFDFRFGMDALGGSAYDMSNRWGDAMEDLDNLDLHVTEEDFDFFESEPTSNKAPASQQQQQQHADFNNDLLKVTTQDFQQQLQQQQQPSTTNENDRLMLMEGMPLSGIGEVPEADGEIDLDALLGGSNGVLDDDQLLGNTSSQGQPQATTVTTATSGGTQPSPMMTNGNLTATETSADDSAASFKEKSMSLRGMTTSPMLMEPTLENHFVPPDFAPVQFSDGVDNAKYLDGGKFMYAPKKDESARDPISIKRKRRLRRSLYRPDYVPRIRKRIKNKDDTNNSIVHTYPNYTPPSIRPLLMYRPNNSTTAVNKYHKPPQQTTLDLAEEEESSCSSSSSTDDDESSSSCSEEACDEEDEIKSYSSQEKKKSDSHDPEWWMSGLQSVHDSVVDQLLVASPSMRRNGSDTETKSDTRTIQSQEDFKVLDYLCQQVVMGGYPFDNGLSAVSSNLGQVHIGESTTALVAQRRKLLQRAHGAFSHVPSLSNDFHRVSQDFKDVLMNIFDRTRTSTVTTPDANSSSSATNADGGMLPMTVGTVAVKGPLSVQQYYDLSETSQAQSKYGKYQVRKRRPAEPNLDTLTPPDILAGRHEEEYIEGSPQMITMWEKLRLEPYSSRKNVLYFVVYPANEQLESTCSHFFKALSTVYESCHLGIHHSGTISTYRRGLVPVPLLPPSSPNETWEERQLRSYNAECQNLGSALGNAMVERMHIVIYIVNPSNTMSSHFDLSRCYHKLMVAYHAASMGISTHSLQERRARLVMQLVPIEHIIRSSSAFGGYTKFGLKDIAFSVYSKCLPVMSRKHPKPDVEDAGPIASTMYAPPFILAKSSPDTIQFSLKGSANLFPTILESNATLHMAYSFTLDRRWIILVWTDNQGELLEYAVRYIDNDKTMAQVIEDAWKQTLQVSARTGFEWTFVIAKVGLMFLEELQMWADCIPNDAKVAITCVDMESALRVNADQLHGSSINIASVMDYPQTPGSSSANTPTPEAFSTTSMPSSAVGGIKNNVSDTGSAAAAAAANNDMSGATKTLLLNHRVAYSQQRAQVSEALVGGLNDEADGNWMLPLATGYLIHIYAKPENPCREQINNEPLIMDVHLLFNQTSHSAYSTLRNIIKRYHALAYVYTTPSAGGSLPIHVVLVSRLEHVLSIISKT